jgi:hypothetical protein
VPVVASQTAQVKTVALTAAVSAVAPAWVPRMTVLTASASVRQLAVVRSAALMVAETSVVPA